MIRDSCGVTCFRFVYHQERYYFKGQINHSINIVFISTENLLVLYSFVSIQMLTGTLLKDPSLVLHLLGTPPLTECIKSSGHIDLCSLVPSIFIFYSIFLNCLRCKVHTERIRQSSSNLKNSLYSIRTELSMNRGIYETQFPIYNK